MWSILTRISKGYCARTGNTVIAFYYKGVEWKMPQF
jgi:hypothetical protein